MIFFEARTVVEEAEVTDFVRENEREWPRISDVFEGLKWGLARAPETGLQLDGAWIFKTYPWNVSGTPSLRALYTFTEDEVTIIAVGIGDD